MLVIALLVVALALPLQGNANSATAKHRAQKQASPELTILFFTAPWCEPCRAVRPLLDEFVQKNGKAAKLVLVDFDHAPDEALRWDVEKIPVVIVISARGNLMMRCDGADRQALDALRSGLEKLATSLKERR